jgi:F-type H+-transporting ATPase subunit b
MSLARGYRYVAAGAVWLLAALPAAAQAAEEAAHGGAEGGEQPSLFAGDLGNVIWTMVIFLLLLVVLGKYTWRPMLDALNRREKFIRETIEAAQKERAEAERMMAEYRQAMARSKQEAQAILDQGRQDAEAARQRLAQQAQQESEQIIGRAKQEIQMAKQSALQDLQNVAADLSVNVASKIIQRNLTAADQQRLVEESLKQLVRGNGGAES